MKPENFKPSLFNTMMDEFAFLFSRRGMPYDKVAMGIMLIFTLLMSAIFHFNYAEEAKVTIIDLDNSRYTHELIDKVDASPFMEVNAVLNTPVDSNSLFYEDKCIAVVYFPQDFEKEVYASAKADVGVFYDNTNSAQTAGVKKALNTILGIENAILTESTGGSAEKGLSLVDRELYNPHDSSANGEVAGFLFFFSSMFFVFATIGIIPRLRMTHQLDKHLDNGNPFELMMRVIPYIMILMGALFMGMVILKFINGMTVSGNPFMFFLTQIMYTFTLGLLSLWFGWYAENPGVAASRMILFVPGGFILGGMTGPIPMIDPIFQYLSHIFPLTWEFELLRDIIFRGASFWDCATKIGQFMVYCSIVAILFVKRFYGNKEKLALQRANGNDDDEE